MSSQITHSMPDKASQAYVTTVALGLAAWLIFNSHLEAFYPIPWLAADGLLGNTLFFVISGLGIFSSLNQRRQNFGAYASRRFWRLYPAVLIALAFQMLFISRSYSADPMEILGMLFWPTRFTYVGIIVPMYLLAFASHRFWPKYAAIFLASLCLLVYGVAYVHSMESFHTDTKLSIGTLLPLVSYAYFGFAFCLGGMLASRHSVAGFRWPWFWLAVLMTTLYVGIKYAMVVRGIGAIAYPVLHVLVLLLCLLALKLLCAPDLVARVLNWPLVGPFLAKSGSLSLEIYLVHAVLLEIAVFAAIAFPLNILFFAFVTFLLAMALQRLTKFLQGHFEK